MIELPLINGNELEEYVRKRAAIRYAERFHKSSYTAEDLDQVKADFEFDMMRIRSRAAINWIIGVRQILSIGEEKDTYQIKDGEIKTIALSPYLRPSKQIL